MRFTYRRTNKDLIQPHGQPNNLFPSSTGSGAAVSKKRRDSLKKKQPMLHVSTTKSTTIAPNTPTTPITSSLFHPTSPTVSNNTTPTVTPVQEQQWITVDDIIVQMYQCRNTFFVNRLFLNEVKAGLEYNIHKDTVIRMLQVIETYPNMSAESKQQIAVLLHRIKDRCLVLICAENKGWDAARELRDYLTSSAPIIVTHNNCSVPTAHGQYASFPSRVNIDASYCKQYVNDVNRAVEFASMQFERRMVHQYRMITQSGLLGRVGTNSLDRHIKTNVYHCIYSELSSQPTTMAHQQEQCL